MFKDPKMGTTTCHSLNKIATILILLMTLNIQALITSDDVKDLGIVLKKNVTRPCMQKLT